MALYLINPPSLHLAIVTEAKNFAAHPSCQLLGPCVESDAYLNTQMCLHVYLTYVLCYNATHSTVLPLSSL